MSALSPPPPPPPPLNYARGMLRFDRTHARTQYPLPFFLRKHSFDFLIAREEVVSFSFAATRRRIRLIRLRRRIEPLFSRFHPREKLRRRSLSRSTYRRRGIISLALYSQHAYLLEARVTATPAAPRRSAIELMMLGPRRFNNKPHYLQSALGSITTGSVSDSPGPRSFLSFLSSLPSFAPPNLVRLTLAAAAAAAARVTSPQMRPATDVKSL